LPKLRKEAKTPEQQALITDLFEKITVYDLKAKEAKAVKGRDGLWQTTITVEAQKYYADEKGVEKEAGLSEAIEIGLFNERPGIGAFGKKDVIAIERRPVKNGKQQIRRHLENQAQICGDRLVQFLHRPQFGR
jgi:ABC-2 type transport system permease protein